METTGWLIDRSALPRLGSSPDADEWGSRIDRGLVRINIVTELGLGFTARNAADLRAMRRRPPLSAMPVEYATPAMEERAIEIQVLLAEHGHHRAVDVMNMLTAATAERLEMTVLHFDKDFELIAEVTGQPVERLRLQ